MKKTNEFNTLSYATRVLCILVCLMIFTANQAEAGPKNLFGWSYWHWVDQTFEPYVYNDQTPHVEIRNRGWVADDWLSQFEQDKILMDRFYKADIIRKQYIEDETAYLGVGPNFYRLGTKEQKRVTDTIDAVYKMTERRQFGTYQLIDWKTDCPVGVYTRYGLMMQ